MVYVSYDHIRLQPVRRDGNAGQIRLRAFRPTCSDRHFGLAAIMVNFRYRLLST